MLGLPFDAPPPYVPIDEGYPGRPESAYSLSKLVGEEMAKQFCRWDPELKIIAPDVPHKRSFGPHETLLAIEKARKILGYEPKHSWRAGKTATHIRGMS